MQLNIDHYIEIIDNYTSLGASCAFYPHRLKMVGTFLNDMADEADIAGKYEEIARQSKIEESTRRASIPTKRSKRCLNCGEPTKNGARWCCAECQQDWHKRTKKYV